MTNRRVSWDKTAVQQFNNAVDYIAKNSLQNADKVRTEVLEKIARLQTHPEQYAPDKYKEDNDGSYRAFELHHLRIAYHVSLRK